MTKQTRPAKPGAARLRAALKPETGALRRGAVLSGLAALIWPAQAALVAHAIATLLQGATPNLALHVGGFIVLGALRAVLGYVSDAGLAAAAERIVARERAAILASEAASVGSNGFGGAGAIAALSVEKLALLVPYVTRYAPAGARVRALPLVILALTASVAWAPAVVLLVAGPLIPVFMALVGMAAQDTSRKQMAEISSLNDLLFDRLSALLDIRLLNADARMIDGFAGAADRLRAQTMAVLRVAFLSSTLLELLAAIGMAMVAVWVGFSLLGAIGWGAWGAGITPGAGIFLLLLVPEYFQPLRDLSAAWHDKAAALAVAEDLEAWEGARATPLLGAGAAAARLVPTSGAPMVVTDQVVFGRGARAITCPDLRIARGETIALMGPSGAGKTTLLRLIAGLDTARSGEIRVAGHLLTAEIADAWRAGLGWMPQAPHFMDASLRQNITFGAPLRPEVLAAVALDPVIAGLPNGLNTRLGETGGGLSGGEARRVMLARALHGAPDLVVADEPTADLDSATAARVTAGLLGHSDRGGTLIVATHDTALAAKMDQIIRIGGTA